MEGDSYDDKVAAKQKLAIFARTKGLLTDTDFQREDAKEFWNRAMASNSPPHIPQAVDIHDSDPRDTVYGWDWDMTDGYFATDQDPTDAQWHPA